MFKSRQFQDMVGVMKLLLRTCHEEELQSRKNMLNLDILEDRQDHIAVERHHAIPQSPVQLCHTRQQIPKNRVAKNTLCTQLNGAGKLGRAAWYKTINRPKKHDAVLLVSSSNTPMTVFLKKRFGNMKRDLLLKT